MPHPRDEQPAIFDRRRSSHPWLRAFEDLESAAEPTLRVVAKNWRMDPRVAEERERAMLAADTFVGEPDGREWWAQRGCYFAIALCRPSEAVPGGPRSAFLEPQNASNRLAGSRLPLHEQLIHAASLNRILARLASGRYGSSMRLRFRRAFSGLPLPPAPDGAGWHDYLGRVDAFAEAFNSRGPRHVQGLAGFLAEHLGPIQPPWWAGLTREVMPVLRRQDWTGLSRALALGHLEAGEWLLVWRYDVGQVLREYLGGACYRPTVIEANDSPWHFPSPPGQLYGITMSLDSTARGTCREVIHAPLKALAAESCTGILGRIADPPVEDYNDLLTLRQRQRARLARIGPDRATTRAWLDRHPEPR